MTEDKHTKPVTRRTFLKSAGTGTAGIAAAAVVATTLGEGEPEAEAAPASDRSDRYRETPHVRHYYATARF